MPQVFQTISKGSATMGIITITTDGFEKSSVSIKVNADQKKLARVVSAALSEEEPAKLPSLSGLGSIRDISVSAVTPRKPDGLMYESASLSTPMERNARFFEDIASPLSRRGDEAADKSMREQEPLVDTADELKEADVTVYANEADCGYTWESRDSHIGSYPIKVVVSGGNEADTLIAEILDIVKDAGDLCRSAVLREILVVGGSMSVKLLCPPNFDGFGSMEIFATLHGLTQSYLSANAYKSWVTALLRVRSYASSLKDTPLFGHNSDYTSRKFLETRDAITRILCGMVNGSYDLYFLNPYIIRHGTMAGIREAIVDVAPTRRSRQPANAVLCTPIIRSISEYLGMPSHGRFSGDLDVCELAACIHTYIPTTDFDSCMVCGERVINELQAFIADPSGFYPPAAKRKMGKKSKVPPSRCALGETDTLTSVLDCEEAIPLRAKTVGFYPDANASASQLTIAAVGDGGRLPLKIAAAENLDRQLSAVKVADEVGSSEQLDNQVEGTSEDSGL